MRVLSGSATNRAPMTPNDDASATESMQRQSITYPPWLDDLINQQVDAGVSPSKSAWWRESAYLRLSYQGNVVEAMGYDALLDEHDPEELQERIWSFRAGNIPSDVEEVDD